MKSLLIGIMIFMAFFLSPTIAIGQTGFWTDEGNYDETWPEGHIENGIYEIRDAKDLAAFARTVNGNTYYDKKTIKIVDDIDLSAHYWKPIGYSSTNSVKFVGTFDGGKYTISNIHIDISSLKSLPPNEDLLFVGFFSENNGLICNTNLQNIHITGTNETLDCKIGGLVGCNRKSNNIGIIEGCSVSGDQNMVNNISFSENYRKIVIGGICGDNETYSSIKNCINQIPITPVPINGGKVYIGGIAGEGAGFITDCRNEGNITGQCTAIGGIVGNAESNSDLYGTIQGCRNNGDVTNLTGASAGGIAGTGSHISYCSNSGNVSSYYKAAGIVGNMPVKYTSPIMYCSNSGSISVNLGISDNPGSSTCYCGGIVTDGGAYKISNCYNTGNLSVKPIEGANVGKVYVGGIAASVGTYVVQADLLSNCYNTGNISVQTPDFCYAGGIIGDGEIKEVSSCYNTGKIDVKSNNNKTVVAKGISEKATGCLSLAKDKTTPFIRVFGDSKSKAHRLTTYNSSCENNYANAPMLLQIGDQISVATENIAHNDVNGANWQDTDNTSLPISNWSDEAWDKSNNAIFPQLKYEDGTLMPGQPNLLKSDFPTETPSEPEQPVSPSDATLKSLSYKIGEDGQATPVPNFSPDVYQYEIGYKSNEDALAAGQAPIYSDGTRVYPSGVATNEEAQVLPSDMLLPYGFVKVGVVSEDKTTERTYSLFMMSEKDAGKKYYVMMDLEHLTLQINGKTYKNGDIYKADHNEDVTVKLIPDQGYKQPNSMAIDNGGLISLLETGQSSEINLGKISWHMGLSVSAIENTGQEDRNIFVHDSLKYKITGDNTVSVLGPDTDDGSTWPVTDCTIPATITERGKTYQVTSIGESAFYPCEKLAKVTLPDGLKIISKNAFKHCYALTSIDIPASVETIGQYAFDMDENLEQVTLHEGLREIGEGAFDECNVKEITIPASVTLLGYMEEGQNDPYIGILERINVQSGNTVYASVDGILYNKAKTILMLCPTEYPVKNVILPAGLVRIEDNAMEQCEFIESLVLPESLEVIEEGAFEYCEALKSITIPSTLKEMGGYLFGTSYTEDKVCALQEIHSSHKAPGDIKMDNEDPLATIDFNTCKLYVPKGTKAKYQAAESWNRFKNIIEEGADEPQPVASFTVGQLEYTVIGKNEVAISGVTDKTPAYYDIKQTVTYENIVYKVTTVGKEAFKGCTNLVRFNPESIRMVIDSIGDKAFDGCSKLSNLIFSEGLKTIGDYAFNGCVSLGTIDIPASVTHIGEGVFDDCSKLSQIRVKTANKQYSSGNGVLYDKDQTTLLVYPNMRGKTYIVPQGVTRIESFAFYNCTDLESLTLPDGLVAIGDGAFDGCTGLVSLTLPAGLKSIGMGIVDHCEKTLEELHSEMAQPLPLGENPEYAFFYYSKQSDLCVLYVPKGAKENYSKAAGWKNFKNIVEEGEGEETIPVSGIRLSQDSFTLNIGESVDLEVTVLPANATNQSYSWVSSDPAVVSINADGIIAVKAGEAILTAETQDGGYKASCKIVVLSVMESEVPEATDSTLTITWEPVAEATDYVLKIYRDAAKTEWIATYSFDADGKLVEMELKSTGFSYQVTGLDAGSTYYIETTALKQGERLAQSTTVAKTTGSAVANEDVSVDKPQLRIVNGQIWIQSLLDTEVRIYDLSGYCVWARRISGMSSVRLPSGMYIVLLGDRRYKIVIR